MKHAELACAAERAWNPGGGGHLVPQGLGVEDDDFLRASLLAVAAAWGPAPLAPAA